MAPRAVFIAGGHTDVGKTYVACALIRAARAKGLKVEALKPVASGFDPADWRESDPGRLLDALGLPQTQAELDRITPWRYAAPIAPPVAAALEGRDIFPEEIAEFCAGRLAASEADLFVIEGVGGLMSPLTEESSGLDLMVALGVQTLLVGGTYLGAMSHTLTALEVMRGRGLPIALVVISQDADPAAPDFVQSIALMTAQVGQVALLAAHRDSEDRWASDALYLID